MMRVIFVRQYQFDVGNRKDLRTQLGENPRKHCDLKSSVPEMRGEV